MERIYQMSKVIVIKWNKYLVKLLSPSQIWTPTSRAKTALGGKLLTLVTRKNKNYPLISEKINNQLEKLEAAKAAWLVCLSLLSLTGSLLTGPYLALLGLTGPYWVLLCLTGPYWDLLGHTNPFLHLMTDGRTNERTLQLIGLLSQPKNNNIFIFWLKYSKNILKIKFLD